MTIKGLRIKISLTIHLGSLLVVLTGNRLSNSVPSRTDQSRKKFETVKLFVSSGMKIC